MRRSILLMLAIGACFGIGGLLFGGVLLLGYLDGCPDGARSKLQPAYEEFKSYINDVPVQSYEIVTSCDSGDDNSYLEVKVLPNVSAPAVERQFQGGGWRQEVDVQGGSYYLARKGDIEFQVYVSRSKVPGVHQVTIIVYPWYR